MKPLISVAIPSYNESANLPTLVNRLTSVFSELEDVYRFEVVICDNGSQDSSIDFLRHLSESDQRFKVVRLVRNFNMEGGMMAALTYVCGDACVIMSADLQDPPEMIPQFLSLWREGYHNVYTTITRRGGESFSSNCSSIVLQSEFCVILFSYPQKLKRLSSCVSRGVLCIQCSAGARPILEDNMGVARFQVCRHRV